MSRRFPSLSLAPLVYVLCAGIFLPPPQASAQESGSNLVPHRVEGRPLEGLRVALDIGHSLSSPGALSARGIGEFEFNRNTAATFERMLRAAGAEVIVINRDGSVTSLTKRPLIAGKAKADCFISVHHDSVNNKYKKTWDVDGETQEYADNFRGYSVFASQKNPLAQASRSLAVNIGAAIHETGLRPTMHHNEPIQGENRPFIDRRTGVYEFSDLVVLKTSPIPAVLLECGVIVHREEEILVQQDWYQQALGSALVKALALSLRTGVIEAGGKRPSARTGDPSSNQGDGAPQGAAPSRGGIFSRDSAPSTSGSPERKGLLKRMLGGKD